jgi:hypothetical protein
MTLGRGPACYAPDDESCLRRQLAQVKEENESLHDRLRHAESGAGCHDCGLAYGGDGWIEAVIPDKVWKEISPNHDTSGVLCISCIARRLRGYGLSFDQEVPVWLCGTEPLRAQAGFPIDSEAVLRTFRIGDDTPAPEDAP